MKFQTPLVSATLVRRYKRFLADIILPGGQEVTAHCANPGAMTGLMEPGAGIWVDQNDDPKRKLKFSWKLIELGGGHRACVDTGLANVIAKEALIAGQIDRLAGFDALKPEVKYGQNSRIDFLLTDRNERDTYVEVKSVTLRRSEGLAEFPDSVTKRGTKHLNELSEMVARGHRAVMLYIVQRTDCRRFRVAADIDPGYARAFKNACSSGVEMFCYSTEITPRGIVLAGPLLVETGEQI